MGALPPLTMTKGNLSRRVPPAHSPPVAAVLRPPVPRAVLRQTCRTCPKVQRPALIRRGARRAPSIRREVRIEITKDRPPVHTGGFFFAQKKRRQLGWSTVRRRTGAERFRDSTCSRVP